MKFVLYGNIREAIGEIIQCTDVFNSILNGHYKNKVSKIRTSDKKTSDIIKKELPCFMPSVIYKDLERKGEIEEYNSIHQIDFDKLTNVDEVSKIVKSIPYTFMSFISPSGRGVKVLVKTDSTIHSHKKCFNILKEYYDKAVGVISDPSVSNINRLCFLSYDPNIYMNEDSEVFCHTNHMSEYISYNDKSPKYTWDFTSNVISFTEGHRNTFVFKYACNANRFGLDVNETINYALGFSDSTFKMDEIIRTITSAYSNNTHENGSSRSSFTFNKINFDNPTSTKKGILNYKEANTWIEESKMRPNPKQLVGPFWFEDELCILFSDTNQGKSILAVQISDSISKGTPILGFENAIGKTKVIYCDFELSDKQFELRYKSDKDHYVFDDNFYRVEINSDSDIDDKLTFEESVINSLTDLIESTNIKVVIVDNLTYLSAENEKAKEAMPLMKKLKNLKSKYNLSLLVLAHTPKRDNTKPISNNDISGSKTLVNFCDSSFAIGESSQGSSTKYLKQIKVRNTEFKYDSNNVIVCEIVKPNNFLHFEVSGFDYEQKHLRVVTNKEKEEAIQQATSMFNSGFTKVEIAKQLNVSEGTIRNWINKYKSQDS